MKKERIYNRMSDESFKEVSSILQREALKMLLVAIHRNEIPKDYYIVFYRKGVFSIVPKTSLTSYMCILPNLETSTKSDNPSIFNAQDIVMKMVKDIAEDNSSDYGCYLNVLMNLVIGISNINSDSKEEYEKINWSASYEDFIAWTQKQSSQKILEELAVKFDFEDAYET